MIPFKEIKIGDFIMANNDGDIRQGEVTDINGDEKQICVDTGQEFWYELNQLSAIPLTEEQLLKLKFTKEQHEDGSVKYKKDSFRILIHSKDEFSNFEIWYRDEKRHITQPIGVHNLQNHFHDMTKVYLNEAISN
ncbi:MAG: hypothetical protein HY305_02925 [Sphingobacteriales bacterium]|nr:hypothetical protein [Sphingobacteriales bacterium]